MSQPIQITWALGPPCVIVDPQPVRYPSTKAVKIDGKRVVKETVTEFTVCGSRPAAAEEVEAWKAQP